MHVYVCIWSGAMYRILFSLKEDISKKTKNTESKYLYLIKLSNFLSI